MKRSNESPNKSKKIKKERLYLNLKLCRAKKNPIGIDEHKCDNSSNFIQNQSIQEAMDIFIDTGCTIKKSNLVGGIITLPVNDVNQTNKLNKCIKKLATVEIERSEQDEIFKLFPAEANLKESEVEPTDFYYKVLSKNDPLQLMSKFFVKEGPGDIFIMGSQQMKVTKICPTKDERFNHNVGFASYKMCQNSEIHCLYCLQHEESKKDPIIFPCNCVRGSYHVSCLLKKIRVSSKNKLKPRVRTGIEGSVSAFNIMLYCSECTGMLPRVISFYDQRMELMTVEEPKEPYMIIQPIYGKDYEGGTKKCVYIIHGEEDQVTLLGKSQVCGIRLSNTTVSNVHAGIIFKDGNFYIKHLESKSTTLIQLRDTSINISRSRNLTIQKGKTQYCYEVKDRVQDINNDPY